MLRDVTIFLEIPIIRMKMRVQGMSSKIDVSNGVLERTNKDWQYICEVPNAETIDYISVKVRLSKSHL